MQITATKHKIANKLFGTPVPMATLNWNHPKRKAYRKALLMDVLAGCSVVLGVLFLASVDSLVENFLTYIGM